MGGPTMIRFAGTSAASYSDNASFVARAPSTFVYSFMLNCCFHIFGVWI